MSENLVEVITVSLVRLNTEEVLHFLLDILQIFAAGNILCVKAVAEQHDIDSTIVALGSLLQGNPFSFFVDINPDPFWSGFFAIALAISI